MTVLWQFVWTVKNDKNIRLWKIKEYDVADEQVDEIIKENITVDLPDGTKLVLDSEGNIIEEVAPTTTDASINEFEIEGEDIIVQTKDGIITAVLNKNHEPIEMRSISLDFGVTFTICIMTFRKSGWWLVVGI